MPFLSAPFVAAKVKEGVEDAESLKEGYLDGAWRPVTSSGLMWSPHAVHAPEDEEKEMWRGRRDAFASQARERYTDWQAKQPPSTAASRKSRPPETSFWRHSFRDRDKSRELGRNWASASQVASQRDRIAYAMSEASSTFMQHPPYPKQGGGPRNFAFSYMSSGYDYRSRQPSKEVAGSCPIMRTRPQTESARINEEIEQQRVREMTEGAWSLDPKYGDPVTHAPQSVGNTFRTVRRAAGWRVGGMGVEQGVCC